MRISEQLFHKLEKTFHFILLCIIADRVITRVGPREIYTCVHATRYIFLKVVPLFTAFYYLSRIRHARSPIQFKRIRRFSLDSVCIPMVAQEKKNDYIGPAEVFPYSPVFPYPTRRGLPPLPQVEVSRQGERRRPWIPWDDEDRCRGLAYWQTFSNFTPIWPGAASHFALICTPSRRGVIRRIGTYTPRQAEYRDGTRRKCSERPRGIPVRIAHDFSRSENSPAQIRRPARDRRYFPVCRNSSTIAPWIASTEFGN